ncbi:MAG TPA: Uma2 family endonuclease [Xanthobacteraceae bacterium]|nr:Uma2 family endonuclease [Xanthobacteraceae bacterium]
MALRKERMTVNEFLAWAKQQPERWELLDGVPSAMAPERVVHGDTKYRAARAFDDAIHNARAPCRFVLDSAVVRIDGKNSYQPDVLVYCGEPLPGDALEVPNAVVVVEVLSPGNAITDLRDKLQGYFRVPSILHYLIIDPDKRLVIHHARGRDDTVATRIVTSGQITLEPPGLSLAVADLFAQPAN